MLQRLVCVLIHELERDHFSRTARVFDLFPLRLIEWTPTGLRKAKEKKKHIRSSRAVRARLEEEEVRRRRREKSASNVVRDGGKGEIKNQEPKAALPSLVPVARFLRAQE